MVERNWAIEAAQIATGEIDRLPEKAHVVALVGQVQSVQHDLRQALEVLAAVMVDNNMPSIHIPGDFLEKVRGAFIALEIRRHENGSIEVRRRVLPPTPMSRN